MVVKSVWIFRNVVLFVFLVLFSGCFLSSLFIKLLKKNDFGKDYLEKDHIHKGHHLTTSNNNGLSSEDVEGYYFGSVEYFCHGTCTCAKEEVDDDMGRRNIGYIFTRKISTFLVAISSILAISVAKNQFEDECKNIMMEEDCEESFILSEVDDCVDELTSEQTNEESSEEDQGDDMCLLDTALFGRRTIRDYSDKQIPQDTIQNIIDVGNFAPSARNQQPLRYYVCDDREILKDISDRCLTKSGGGILPRPSVATLGVFYNAPVVVFISWNGGAPGYEKIDAGLAMQNMQLYAYSQGIGSCCVGWCQNVEEYIGEVMGFEKDEKYMCALIMGYPNPERKVVTPKRKKAWVDWDRTKYPYKGQD